MTPETTPAPAPTGENHQPFEHFASLAPLLALFFASGCAALIYEIVWFQLLQLVIGSSVVSLGVLLSAYMGGMCLGSLLFARIVPAARHPLRVYACLEIAIGVLGVASLFGIPLATRLYAELASTGTSDLLMRAVISVLCLLPPTILMGATLPAIARWMEPSPQGASRLGYFYGANIAGAVFGCSLAGFYLLRLYDMAIATYIAAAINLTVGLAGFVLARTLAYRPAPPTEIRSTPTDSPSNNASPKRALWPIYLAITLSGVCALGAEVIWTRQLSLVLGATVYSFSIILAVFLAGLGLGSGLASGLARSMKDPGKALAFAQVLAAGSIAWAGFALARSIPYWPFLPDVASSPWHVFPVDVFRAAYAVLPGAIFWGASFPFALAAAASSEQDTGRLAGRVYAANTLGAIVGALAFSVLFVEWMGTQAGQRVLIAVAGVSAASILVGRLRSVKIVTGAASLACVGALTALSIWLVPQTPTELIGFGHRLPYFQFHDRIGNEPLPAFDYVAEGRNASIAVSTDASGDKAFHVNGKVVASSKSFDMRIQRMLGHLPSLIHGEPKSVLIVGCGTGATAGTFTCYPSVERIVICEIEPLIPGAAGKYFAHENHDVMNDPRVEVFYDDARHFVLATDEKFDIITSDPIHPWVKGAASLYSKEYFELCRKKLKPGGVVTQWVPLYETNLESVQSTFATFFAAFPHVTVWGNELNSGSEQAPTTNRPANSGLAHDVVLLGQNEAIQIDVAALGDRITSNPKVHHALNELALADPMTLLSTFAARGSELASWVEGAQINRDANLRLQYLAGMAKSQQVSQEIYDSILAHRQGTKDIFIDATEEDDRMDLLRELRQITELMKKSRAEQEREGASMDPGHQPTSAGQVD